MAIPTAWYTRVNGSALNSGGTDTDAPEINGDAGTPFVVAGGTGLTYAPGGLTGKGNSAINLQIAGVSTIRGITILTDTTATLDAAVADGSYNGRIGGARAMPNQAANSGAGNNAKIASGHLVTVQTGTYVGLLVLNASVIIRGGANVEWTVDGTGGGAGSDPVTIAAASISLWDCVSVNAVDDAFTRTAGGAAMTRCRAVSPGGDGLSASSETVHFCSFRGCGALGITSVSATVRWTEAGDCVGFGISGGGTGWSTCEWCVVYDCAGGGIQYISAGTRLAYCRHNTIDGVTGVGLQIGGVGSIAAGSMVTDNSISNSSTYGVDVAAGGPLTAADRIYADHNNYYGNALGNRNFIAGAHDLAVDPLFVNAAGDDYTLDTGSQIIEAGYSPLKSPMKWGIGATIAELAAADTDRAAMLVGGGGLVR